MSGIYDPRSNGASAPQSPAPAPAPAPTPAEDTTDLKEFIDKAFELHGYDPIPAVVQQMTAQASLELALGGPAISVRIDVKLDDMAPATVAAPKAALLTQTRRIGLGTHDMPNQSRTHKHGNFDYRWETRSAWKKAYVDITHPTLDDFINDAVQCAQGAASVAVLTAIFAENPAAGFAIFWPAFKACMYTKIGARVDQLSATLGSSDETGCWTYHCP